MIINLPFPHKDLNPNRSNGKHYMVTKPLKDKARTDAFNLTRSLIKVNPSLPDEKIAIEITYIQKDRRKRDLDNLLAASKASLDGVAIALGIDDKNFDPITIKRGFDSEAVMRIEILRACAITKKG